MQVIGTLCSDSSPNGGSIHGSESIRGLAFSRFRRQLKATSSLFTSRRYLRRIIVAIATDTSAARGAGHHISPRAARRCSFANQERIDLSATESGVAANRQALIATADRGPVFFDAFRQSQIVATQHRWFHRHAHRFKACASMAGGGVAPSNCGRFPLFLWEDRRADSIGWHDIRMTRGTSGASFFLSRIRNLFHCRHDRLK